MPLLKGQFPASTAEKLGSIGSGHLRHCSSDKVCKLEVFPSVKKKLPQVSHSRMSFPLTACKFLSIHFG